MYSKEQLLEMFASEERMGVWYNTEGTSTITHKGLNIAFGHCTTVARYISDILGIADCQIQGFLAKDNPRAAITKHLMSGHDFVVYDGRYIIDPWISHFIGATEQYIWDLYDSEDYEEARRLFGSRCNWSEIDPVFNPDFLILVHSL